MKKIFEVILNFLKSEKLKILLNITAIVIAIIAVNIAEKSNESANQQFERNLIASDSLFNVQLKQSKELNDSLINILQGIQQITGSQLKITNEQLTISTETLKNKIYSDRPKLVTNKIDMIDTSQIKSITKPYNIKIVTKINNEGVRPARKVEAMFYLLDKDFKIITSEGLVQNDDLMRNVVTNFVFISPIPFHNRQNFYFGFEVRYYDDKLKSNFKLVNYFHYFNFGGADGFYICKINEAKKVKEKINYQRFELNEDRFDN